MKLVFKFAILALVFTSYVQACGKNTFEVQGVCKCNDGFYANTQKDADTTGCTQCPDQSHPSGNAIGGVSQCDSCNTGYFIEEDAKDGKSAKCGACPSNTLAWKIAQPQFCDACLPGFYTIQKSTKNSHASCAQCPNNTTTNKEYSQETKISDCKICKENYYMSKAATETEAAKCTMCPQFTTFNAGYTINCRCNDKNANFSEEMNKCVCNSDFEGEGTPSSPCKPADHSNGNVLMTSVALMLVFAFSL